jgi:hypothetical protein
MRLDFCIALKGPYRAKPFHDRTPGAALEESLAPGWYVRPFQGTELRLKGQNRDQRSSFNTFSTGEIRMLGRSFAVSPSMFLSGLYRIADFVETGMGLSHFARSITDPA